MTPVGTVEIAFRLGVTRSAVDQWRHRHAAFPQPRWTVGGRPAWEWSEVEEWARRTGRLADDCEVPTHLLEGPRFGEVIRARRPLERPDPPGVTYEAMYDPDNEQGVRMTPVRPLERAEVEPRFKGGRK